ncbi:MAG: hypothetical protein U0X73_13400 [Thermoanaerobaculia bacterium]
MPAILSSARFRPWWAAAPPLLLWLAICLPLAAGGRTLVLRDVFTTHLHAKAFGARELAAGTIPAFDPGWGLGQPFAGNPNVLAFYPDNLLYLALPFWSAFNLHYLLHWLLAFVAMTALARRLGQTVEAALLAGIAYAGSGYVLSTLTFYNLVTVAAWWPLVLWGAAGDDRRGLAAGGVACGMALLGGEPITAAIGLAPLVLLALERHGARRGLLRVLAIGALGLVVALPQLVATARVLPFSVRGGPGLDAAQAGNQALHPLRLLELVLPLPWGWPSDLGRFGYWSNEVTPIVPYIYSLHFGVVALAMAIWALAARRRWALAAGGALFAAWAGGQVGALLARSTGGLFRYPQKLLFVFALAAALLAGWGLDRMRETPRRAALAVAVGGGLLLGAALALRLAFAAALEALAATVGRGVARDIVATQLGQWVVTLAIGGALLLLAALAIARGWSGATAGLALAALLPLAPMLPSDATAPYRAAPDWVARLGERSAVVQVAETFPRWEPQVPVRFDRASAVDLARRAALELDPSPGVRFGLTYPLAPDLEGMSSPLTVLLGKWLAGADWETRVRWLRLLGVGWVVREGPGDVAGLATAAEQTIDGVRSTLLAVPDPLPPVAWAASAEVASGALDALARVSRLASPAASVVLSRPAEHRPGGVARLVAAAADRLEVEVESDGGVLLVQRAYQPLYRARLAGSGARLATQPVDFALLGVEVPPGKHRVLIDVDRAPEFVAGALAVAALCIALAVVWRGR